MALAPHIGRLQAHHLVEAACKTAVAKGVHLRDVITETRSSLKTILALAQDFRNF